MEKLLQELIKFREERDWGRFHSPKNLAMALMVEAGELTEHFQWLTQEQSQNLPDEKKALVKDEIGDVFIYLLNLADRLGIDPLQAARDKLEKNREKYPALKVKGKALKYDEY
ncbi:MAG: nucleotide pyrophosphohydrolase [Proteobacteria bacterium]|nr:nucleotide pyrophosphohydrolase [Pseudomonadota bacterium]